MFRETAIRPPFGRWLEGAQVRTAVACCYFCLEKGAKYAILSLCIRQPLVAQAIRGKSGHAHVLQKSGAR